MEISNLKNRNENFEIQIVNLRRKFNSPIQTVNFLIEISKMLGNIWGWSPLCIKYSSTVDTIVSFVLINQSTDSIERPPQYRVIGINVELVEMRP